MNDKKKTGPSAAGQAKPCPLQQLRPFRGMTEAQTSAIVRRAQGSPGDTGSRVLQDLCTVRNDVQVGDALDTIGHLLYQADGILGVMSESKDTPQPYGAALWGVQQLLQQAQAALSVLDQARGVEVLEGGTP